MRVTNQKEFIDRANEIHDYKYNYSLVEYRKSSEKVKIICPIHGEFEQTPNKHLAGQGCKQCGRNRTKLGKDVFMDRARMVHGNKYDYSKVDYKRSDEKVEIVCPVHGSFYQTPHSHLVLAQGCPKCAAIAGGVKRRGDNNVARLVSVKEKKRTTCQEKYGANTWAESDEGRQKLHEIITSEDVANKMINTCQEKYGANTWAESDEGRQKLHDIMSSSEMKQKVVEGYQNQYGVDHYMKTDEGREKARNNMNSPERREKIRESMYEKYGAYSFFASDTYKSMLPVVKEKIKQICIEKYGVPYALMNSDIHAKSDRTKRVNGTFNSSKPEQTLLLLLQDVFGKDNVKSQYRSDAYPFNCDFYVISLDLYIELNASWTHGGHWFDATNPFDIDKLNMWKDKAREKGSRYYYNAIDIWTRRDLIKLQTAIDNNLNYLVFWNNDLSDARDWLKSQHLL